MVWAPEGWFERHLPLALLTGFLGSGKTTLLNRLLLDARLADTAVIINEFGDVPLDQHFVASRPDDVIALPNGCICCFAPGDLEQSLGRLFHREKNGEIRQFKRMIIETSGLAEPEPLLRSLLDSPFLSRLLWLDSVVTTVDAVFAVEQIRRGLQVIKQIRIADRLIVTKSDIAGASKVAEVSSLLAKINPAAHQHTAIDGIVDPEALFSRTFFDELGEPSLIGSWTRYQRDEPALRRDDSAADNIHAGHLDGIGSIVLIANKPLNWRNFDLWLTRIQREHNEKLLRIKGIVNVAGESQPIVIHGIQSVLHVPVALADWPDSDRRSRIVVIFRDLPGEILTQSWEAFLAAQ